MWPIWKILGECRTLWGERKQAACILTTEERMMYQTLLSVREVTNTVVGLKFVVAHFWHQSRWVYTIDCHVSKTFQSILPGHVCSSLGLSSACLIPSQGCSQLMHFFCHHTMCHEYKSELFYRLSAYAQVSVWHQDLVEFRMLCIILHEPDLQCGVTDRHSSSTNTVGLACERDYVGLSHTHPIKHSTVFLMAHPVCL